ncbi:tail fiber domain-containing protein, partial [bacterium]|nr:tail fiber domain-containing protein [bacterium]
QIVGQAGAAISGGTVTVTSPLAITGTVAGNVRSLRMQTSGSTRWEVGPGFDAESGSNVGSTFWITRWSDAGAFLGTPIAIARATGVVTFESQVLVTAGSGSSGSYKPGLSVSGDDDTGVMQVGGANTLSLVTNGTERVRVGSAGRFTFFANSEKYGIQLNNGATANGPFIGSDGADIFTISTAGGAERVRVDASGRVGIGTNLPGQSLHVLGGEFWLTNSNFSLAGGTGSIVTMYTGATTGNTYGGIGALTTGGGVWGDLVLQGGGGRVGIGTTSPPEKLSVFGDNNGGRTSILIDNLDQRLKLSCFYQAGVGQYAEIQSTNNAETGHQNLILNRLGNNVGIGTAIAGTRLSVTGASAAQNGDGFTGIAQFSTGTGAQTDEKLVMGVVDGQYGWIQALKPGTATRAIILNPGGGEVLVSGTTDQGAYNLQCAFTGVWGAGAYVNGSDERIKNDIAPLSSCTDVIESLRPVTFRYKESWSKDQSLQPGFIAQDLQQALAGQPYLDGIVQQGTEYLSVAYQTLIPLLVKALQESNARIAAL